ncbi:unnamed protein product [Oreochromis niloticus]|nr:unnamed protein product [Mustela putorius furo]
MPDDLAATPGPSWAEVDPQPIATTFPSLEAHGDCEFFPHAGVTRGGDANEDGDESADSELLLSDEEEEDSTSLASISWAAKHSATGEVEKPTPPSPLDVDMQDMCKRAAARLNIPWPAIQTEVVKSRFDGKKLPKAKKTGKHVLPVFPELLDEKQRETPHRVLRLHKVAVQATGRAMVLQERARWLGLTNLTTKEKEELLDTPVVPQGLFGAAVTSMQKRY